MVTFYDTHAHLDYPDYEKDFNEVIARAEAAGIVRLISIGTSIASSERAIKLAEQFPMIYAAIGCHPTEAHTTTGDLRPDLRRLATHPKVVAIGEIGLDYYRLPSAFPAENPGISDEAYKLLQAEVFRQQLEVAAECGLNCIIHQRASFEDALAQIKPFAGKTRGVFHCFGESVDRMQQIFSLGWLVSFTGIVTFKNSRNVRDALTAAPLGKFMLETDCPYLAPAPYRGKRCEPAYVKEISETVAQVKGCTLAELSEATCQTAHEFFPKLK